MLSVGRGYVECEEGNEFISSDITISHNHETALYRGLYHRHLIMVFLYDHETALYR